MVLDSTPMGRGTQSLPCYYIDLNRERYSQGMGTSIDNLSTQNQAMVADRQPAPRGITPLIEIGSPNIHRNYLGREDEYLELLRYAYVPLAIWLCSLIQPNRRGATRCMCETFHLRFNKETGIIACADQGLFEAFSGPAMQQGHLWDIHLGRRIELDDDDLDGAQFIEDLLEDAILFPLRSSRSARVQERWETVEDVTGYWVTRPMSNPHVETDDDSDDPDDNSSDCDRYDELEVLRQDQDAALEHSSPAFQWDPNPAIRTEEYEDEPNSDVDMENDSDDEEYDPTVPDTGFGSGEDDEAECDNIEEPHGESAQGDVVARGAGREGEHKDADMGKGNPGGEDEMGVNGSDVTLTDSDDSVDSDFDSDEVLSGDEEALQSARQPYWKNFY